MSSGESLYQDAIKQFAQAAHGHGRLAQASGEAQLDNRLCGDRVRVQVAMLGGQITAVAHETKGCLLCRAAASVIGKHAPGSTPAGIDAVTQALGAMLKAHAPAPANWPELTMFEPVRSYVSRQKCVLLPFHALRDALEQSLHSETSS
ncbi:MAG: iron-sulfur cluster assembly scaffold protein [Sulfuritalea sp.]|nr:iron-sulfur cluster assembly scaffold protein [Sulfuritalea sp.]